MTPITHGLIGWIVSTPLKDRKSRALVTIAGLIPDLDGLGALISIDYYAKFHHVYGHNIFFGLILSFLAFLITRDKILTPLLTFTSFNLHILGDLLGSGAGWGVPYFWPIYNHEFEFSYPLQWELDSWQNLLVTAICIAWIIRIAVKKKRTIVELIHLKTDQKIVDVFNKWFK